MRQEPKIPQAAAWPNQESQLSIPYGLARSGESSQYPLRLGQVGGVSSVSATTRYPLQLGPPALPSETQRPDQCVRPSRVTESGESSPTTGRTQHNNQIRTSSVADRPMLFGFDPDTPCSSIRPHRWPPGGAEDPKILAARADDEDTEGSGDLKFGVVEEDGAEVEEFGPDEGGVEDGKDLAAEAAD
ncbi:hypothetical protein U1Q18_022467 [Sarracenia purpurea var. burkii]